MKAKRTGIGRRMARGFTMIELVVVVVLTGIVASVAIPPLLILVDAMDFDQARNPYLGMGRVAMERSALEIKRLRDEDSVLTANAGTYRFINTDGDTVELRLDGSTFILQINGTDYELADFVTALTFTYYDDFHDTLAAPIVNDATYDATNIRSLRIEAIVGDPASSGGTVRVETEVRPRNLPHLEVLFS